MVEKYPIDVVLKSSMFDVFEYIYITVHVEITKTSRISNLIMIMGFFLCFFVLDDRLKG